MGPSSRGFWCPVGFGEDLEADVVMITKLTAREIQGAGSGFTMPKKPATPRN